MLRQLPLNSQGKLPQAQVEALLLAPRPKAPEVLEQIEANGEWTLQLSIPPDLAYFSGHFPVTPVLPKCRSCWCTAKPGAAASASN